MGFSFEALVDKVGHKIDKKGSNAVSKHQGSYGRMSKSHVSSEPLSQCSEHSQGDNSNSFTGVGLLGMGREPGRPITHSNYHDSRPPDKETNMLEGNTDSRKQYHAPPPAFKEPAFTGGGLLGKMMNARRDDGREAFEKLEVGPGPGPPCARQGTGRSSSDGQQGPRGRYRHGNGPPRHKDLRHGGRLGHGHEREYQLEAIHEHRRHGSGRHGAKEFGKNKQARRGDEEKMQNPFDDRERY